MVLFLEILGVIFLIFLLIIAFFGWKFYRGYKNIVTSCNSDLFTVLSVIPPIQLELEAGSLQNWKNQQQLVNDQAQLEKLCFTHKGYFCVEHDLSTIQVSLWQLKNSISVAIQEGVANDCEDSAKYNIDAVVMLNDGGSLSVSNSEFSDLLPRPEKFRLVRTESQNIIELLALVKSSVPSELKPIAIKDTRVIYKECYEEMMEWLWQEPQLRSEKIQQVLSPLNIEVNDELIEQLLEHADSCLSEIHSERALKRLAQTPSISAAQWEDMRDRLIVIHDKMNAQSLTENLYEMIGDNEDHEELLDQLSKKKTINHPIQTFNEFFQRLQLDQGHRRIATLQKPVAAEIYLSR